MQEPGDRPLVVAAAAQAVRNGRVVLRPHKSGDRCTGLEAGRERRQIAQRDRHGAGPDELCHEIAADADMRRTGDRHGVLDVVEVALEVVAGRVDRGGERHDPDQPVAHGDRAQLVVRGVPRRVADRPAAGVADDQGGIVAGPVEHVRESLLGRMREVDGAAEREQAVDELVAEGAQPTGAGLAGAVGECVPPRPCEADHAHAERPERVDQLGAGSESLGPLQREHQPDPLAALRLVEPGDGAHLEHAVGALPHRVVERAGELKR